MEELSKKSIKRDFNHLGISLLISQILMLAISFLGVIVTTLIIRTYNPLDSGEAIYQQVMQQISESGWILIVAAIGHLLPPLFLSIKKNRFDTVPDQNAPAGPLHFLFFFILLLGIQVLLSIALYPLLSYMEGAGYSFSAAEEAASGMSDTTSMLFYSIAVAPVVEELIYRGLVLRYLERYGRWFAVFASAILFALMHGNIIQFPVALAAGLVLGYITVQYSIHLAILVHVGNNFFIEAISRLELADAGLAAAIDSSVSLIAMMVAAVVLVIRLPAMLRWIRENKGQAHSFRWFFTSWSVVLLVLYLVYMTIGSIGVVS